MHCCIYLTGDGIGLASLKIVNTIDPGLADNA